MLCIALLPLAAMPLTAAQQDEGKQSITLNDALERGLANNLDLKKNYIDLSTAEYSSKRLWSEIFPSISGSLGASYSSALFTGDGVVNFRDGVNFTAGLGITLPFNAGIPYTMKNIRLAYQISLLGYEDARNQLEIQITKIFFSLIADRDNLTSLADMLQLAQLQHDKNQIAFNNGLAGERVLMQSRLGLENARYNLSAARSTYANRMGEFLSLLGIAHDADPVLEGKIEIAKIEVDAEQFIREYLPRRPDIVGRRQEIEQLENAAKQAVLSGRAPSLSLSLNWNDQKKGNKPLVDSLEGRATVNVPIDPWIPGSKTGQSIRKARAAIDKARLDLQRTEEAAASQIRSLAANLQNSWNSIEIARLSLSIAERGYELTEQGFRNGTVDSVSLEDSRNDLANTRQRLLQSELSYLNTFLDLSAALNKSWKELQRDYMPQE
jgi:outer membrane protein TolC